MAAIVDLNWQQLLDALGGNSKIFVGEDPLGNIGILISVTEVNQDATSAMSANGVVKCLMRLREAAAKAQSSVNASVAPSEQLQAFPPASSNGQVINGYVNQTGEIKTAIEVSSAANVVGFTDPYSQ